MKGGRGPRRGGADRHAGATREGKSSSSAGPALMMKLDAEWRSPRAIAIAGQGSMDGKTWMPMFSLACKK